MEIFKKYKISIITIVLCLFFVGGINVIDAARTSTTGGFDPGSGDLGMGGFDINNVGTTTSDHFIATSTTTDSIFGSIVPITDSTFDLGTPINRWANGYFDNLDTVTITIGGASAGNLDMGGFDITNVGLTTGTHFVATSTTATSTFAGGIGATDMTVSNIWADTDTSGVLTLGGVGSTNNENITFDFETTANFVLLDSTTGATTFDFNTFNGRIRDSKQFVFGNGQDTAFAWELTGNDSFQLGLVAADALSSGYFSIMEKADLGNANRSPLATSSDPVLRIYSSDETNATDYLEFFHNQSNPIIQSGGGTLVFNTPDTSTFTYQFGGQSALAMINNTTFDQLLFAIDDNAGNQLVLTNFANRTMDHDHAATTDPTLFIHSDTDPDIDNTQYLSLTHDQTNAVFGLGSGAYIFPNGDLAVGTSTTDSILNLVDADPILLMKDTDTSVTTANTTIRLAESGAGGVTDTFWDVKADNSVGDFGFSIGNNSNANLLNILFSSGNIGISSTTPQRDLSVDGAIVSQEASPTDGATVTFDLSTANQFRVVLGGNRTIDITNQDEALGQGVRFVICQDSTGSRTLTWDTAIRWAGGAAPTLTTTADHCDVIAGFTTLGTSTPVILLDAVADF